MPDKKKTDKIWVLVKKYVLLFIQSVEYTHSIDHLHDEYRFIYISAST